MKIIKRIPAAFAVLLVLLCAFGATAGTAAVRFEKTYASFLAYSHERYSQAIREHLSASLVNAGSAAFALEGSDKFADIYKGGSKPDMLGYIRQLCEEFKISYVNVVDKNGNIVLRSYMPDDDGHDSIAYQAGVKEALSGKRFSCFEKASVVKASARATAPIWDGGEVIGAVVAVFRFDTNEWADALKERYGIEVSIFSEEEGCIATTVEVNGARGIGEPMTEAAGKATCGEGRQFSEHAVLFGTMYDSVYIPIQNPQGGTFVVLCVSMPAAALAGQTFSFTATCAASAAVSLLVTGLVLARFTRKLRRSKKETEAALEEANRANAAKSDALARMSHEIRTPLNAVIGMTELILREEIPEAARRGALVAKQAGKSLLEIINDILDISKIESGKMELVNVDYDVPPLISGVAEMTRARAGDKPIELVTRVSPGFPASLFGDETRVRQVLMNLMGNAVKYTNEGTVTLSGDFEFDGGDKKSGYAVFTVADTGSGIKEEDLGKLFESFAQVDMKANRKVEGTGLGLAITKNLAEMMGGGVTVESEYGKGSAFTVRIRQQVNRYEAVGDISCDAAVPKESRRFNGVKFHAPAASVLVVDDVKANLLVAAGLLSPYGMKVDTAPGGAEAVEMIALNDYDFILMDHMMPGMDGVEATREIRGAQGGRFGKLPIIALTANAVSGMREMFLANGFNGFISKPIDVNELNGVVETWVPKSKRENARKRAGGHSAANEAHFSVDGVDTAEGIARCGGKVGLYRRILRSFAGVLRKHIETFSRMNESGDYDGFAELIHQLKGVSANVGANGIFELAGGLDAAAKAGDNMYIKKNLPPLIERCKSVARAIGCVTFAY